MKLKDVPEQLKIYTVKLSTGSEYTVTGEVKGAILNAKTNFIELETGNVINKSFIVEIKVNPDETRQNVLANRNALIKL